ncbi:hypothetical protein DFH09DRAFT_1202259, partial [Mycena vulgaris]
LWDIDDYERERMSMIFHPLAVRQGRPQDGVVDPDLRIKGIPFLRVVDGFVFLSSSNFCEPWFGR